MDSNPRQTRRELMTRRDAALKAGDIAQFQALTTQIAALPMPGVPALTAKDITRWNKPRFLAAAKTVRESHGGRPTCELVNGELVFTYPDGTKTVGGQRVAS